MDLPAFELLEMCLKNGRKTGPKTGLGKKMFFAIIGVDYQMVVVILTKHQKGA